MAKRKRPASKPTVYRAPYWFDRARSINELEGVTNSPSSFGTGLVGRVESARAAPIGSLTVEQLALLLEQQLGAPHWIVPLALPFVRLSMVSGRFDEERLLASVLHLPDDFWATHPALSDEMAKQLRDEERLFESPDLTMIATSVRRFLSAHEQRQRETK